MHLKLSYNLSADVSTLFGAGKPGTGSSETHKGKWLLFKGTISVICFFKINTREQQQKAVRKWVTFPTSKHKKSPGLWNRKSRSRPSCQWLLSRASLVRHSSSLCLVTNGHCDGGVTSSSICTYTTGQSFSPYLHPTPPNSLVYSQIYWKDLTLAPVWFFKCKTNKQQRLRFDNFIWNQRAQLL